MTADPSTPSLSRLVYSTVRERIILG
ncbi:MAG: hypothetical protein QOJ95_95, partial [Mycobacterium sp.]|nr:hypothetical protein [Mycobacterium sp.]